MIKSRRKNAKPCKGYKNTAGYGCSKPITIHTSGLCDTCLNKWKIDQIKQGNTKVLSSITRKAKIEVNKVVKKEKKEIAKQKRERINYAGKLQVKVQEIARLIDVGHPCLARGKMALNFDGGHLWAKGGHSECKYNLHNIFAQDSKSNQSTKEDQLMSEGLRREFGQDYFIFVESLKGKPITKHLKADVEQMYRRACSIANRLLKEGKLHTKEERISLRNQFNLEIGYYTEEYCVFKPNQK